MNEYRQARGITLIEHTIHDLSYGFRILRKSPGLAFAVIATLALGIGATTAVFSVVYGVTLRPLPYPRSEQLVTIGHESYPLPTVGAANYAEWRIQNTVFEDVGLIQQNSNFNITGDGGPERAIGARSTASMFRVLDVLPSIGRVFTEEEEQNEDKVLLSHSLWTRRYGADRAILGKKILLNGSPYTVIGVMPAEFSFPNHELQLWVPLRANPDENRGTFAYACIARLKNGVTLAQAQAQMSEIHSRIKRGYPNLQRTGMVVSPTLDNLVGDVRRPLYVLMGGVLCLLLIGCANLAGLLLARSLARCQELVVRAALGANKRRLVLQSVMELVPLVVLGGASGLMLAQWLLFLLVPLLPATLPRLESIRMDWQVLAVATGLLFATALAAGIWPALQVMHWNVNQALRESGRSISSGGKASRLRSALVVGQIATVVVLMVVSALLIRSFIALQNVDPGFRSNNILSVHFALSEKHRNNPAFGQYLQRISERVSALPGVLSVGLVNRLPLAGGQQSGSLIFEGSALPPASIALDFRTATPEYFQTLGIPLIEGRLFQNSDTSDHPVVGIIDQKLAQLMWPNQSAIGRRFRSTADGAPWMEIVGVVGHIRNDGLGIDLRPQLYWNYQQRAQARMVLAVRTNNEPKLLSASVIKAIHEIDPEQPVYDVRSMEEVVERSLSPQWLNMTLLSLFASVALVLATVGIYGVLSYSVGLRAREIGIRMALGSQRGEVIRMVLRQAAFLAGLGTLIGIAGSLLLGRALEALLYEIRPTDVLSFLLAALTLLVVALAASFVPARRAASVDPLSVLRSE